MSNPNTMNEQVKPRESMARPVNEGKWRRRALSVAKTVKSAVGSAGHFVTETKVGKLAAAAVLVGALSQTNAGKDITQKVVTGTEDLAGAALDVTGDVLRPVADLITGPHFENNPTALNDAKVIHHEKPPKKGEQHFAHNITVTSEDPTKTRVNVFPLNSNVAGEVLVLPIGTIPVGTTFDTALMTNGFKRHFGVNDYSKPENDRVNTGYTTSETYAAVDCNVIASIILDPNSNPMPDIAQNYPVCYIEGSNVKKAK